MIGYKTLSQFSFDDCVNHIKCRRRKGVNPDIEIEKLFSSLLNELHLKDDALYKENKTSIRGCKKYIKSFPIADAKSYKARHLDEAKQIIDKLEKRNKQIRIRCFLFLTAVIFVILAIWGWRSYKPLPNLSLQDKIEVSQYGDTILLSNYLQGIDNRTKIYIEDDQELKADNSLGYSIYRNDKEFAYDIGPAKSSDYMDLSWSKRIFLHKKYIIPMNCSQDVIRKRIRIETYSEIFGLIIENRTNFIKIQQRSGGATFMYYDESHQKCYANKRIDVENKGIIGNSYPVFLHTDGTYVNVHISDRWITVEKRQDLEEDNYNFHIRVKENRTPYKRIGTVKFSSGDKYIEFEISQANGLANFFDITKDEVYVSPEEVWTDGEDFIFFYEDKINTDGIWDYKLCDDYGWIKVMKAPDALRFQVKKNDGYDRKASIDVSTLNLGTKTINITQKGVLAE